MLKQLLRVAPIALVAALVVPSMNEPQLAHASPVDQQREKVQDIVDELERLEEQAIVIGEQYVEAIDSKDALDAEIVDLEADIATQEAEISDLRSDLGEMAVRSYVGAGTTPLGPLFEDTADINDVLRRDQLARVALSTGDATTDELDALVSGLEDDRAELDDKRAEVADLADELSSAQDRTEELTTEYTQARNRAEAELGELIAEEEARRAAESAARVQAELEAAQAEAARQAADQQAAASRQAADQQGGQAPAPQATTQRSSGSGSSSGGGSGSSGGGSGSSGGGGQAPAPAPQPAPAPAPEPAPAPVAPPAPQPEPEPAPAPAPPPSSRSSVAVNAAMSQLGVPYVYATSKPGVSFDCSGLTKYAWAQAGVYLPHQSRQQYASIPHVDKASAQPGDLIFFYSPISHVSVYLGNGQHVHAPNSGSVVKTGAVNWGKVTGVGRPG